MENMDKSHASSRSFFHRLVLMLTILGFPGAAFAATLSLSPAAISNTYAGMLTLNIGDLTNGETVRVERVLDVNGNGVVDADDFLTMRVSLTDGQVATIGGATNLNVPGDSNPTSGAITAKLNYYGQGLDHLVARHLWRLESPSGRFTAVTNAFTITNTAFAQGVNGVVQSSGTNVPYAVVVALDPLRDDFFIASTVTDASGHYTLKQPPGFCQLIAVRPGFVTDMMAMPQTNLAAGATLTVNLEVLPATRVISGQLTDAANAATTLPGVFLNAESEMGQFAPAWTDHAGNFTVAVNADEWGIETEYADLNRLGYLFSYDEGDRIFDTRAGNVTGVVLSATKANALIYGRVLNQANGPIPGVLLWANGGNEAGGYDGADPVSDDNGNYAAPMVGGLLGGWYNLLTDPWLNPNLSNMVVSGFLFGTSLAEGQALRQDLRAINATNRISGEVREASGSPMPGVIVFGWADLGGTTYYGSAGGTDLDGHYSMNVAGNSWMVQAGTTDLWEDGYNCAPPKAITLSGSPGTLNFTVYPSDGPALSDVVWSSPGQIQFSLHGEPFVSHAIEYSTNLINWLPLTSITPQIFGWAYVNCTVTDNAAGGPCRYYRAIRSGGDNDDFISIQGTVRDSETHAPLAGALVTTSLDGTSAVSDGNGSFFLQTQTPVGDGNTHYTIMASKSGYQSSIAPGNWGGHPSGLVIDLTREDCVSIQGLVRNIITSDPIAGAVVATSLDSVSVVTDSNGNFFLQTQTPSVYSSTPYTITVTKSGFQPFSGYWIWGDHPGGLVFELYP